MDKDFMAEDMAVALEKVVVGAAVMVAFDGQVVAIDGLEE